MFWMRNARLASLLCLVVFVAPVSAQAPKADKPAAPAAASPGRSSRLQVVIEMDRGKLAFELYSEAAPKTLARFLNLIQKGFYNGLTFYRVVPKYLIQAGDPAGDGTGGSGQTVPAEFSEKKHVTGTVGMAHTKDSDNADSQFYICLEPQPFLDGKYTVIGQVVEGLDLLPKIQEGDVIRKMTVKP